MDRQPPNTGLLATDCVEITKLRRTHEDRVVQLRQTDPHVDWSAVNESEDLRRVLIYLDQSE